MYKKEDESLITYIFAVKNLFDRTVASNFSHFFLARLKQTSSPFFLHVCWVIFWQVLTIISNYVKKYIIHSVIIKK